MIYPKFDVFIDGGGNNFLGVERYLKKFPKFDKVWIFEPNPFFHSTYDNCKFDLVKKAIWTDNCIKPFYISKDENKVSSSLIKDKLCRNKKEYIPFYEEDFIEIECVDFSEWIKSNIKPYFNLTLKLDIEGAEYDVLSKMIEDETIYFVKTLYVEFHQKAMKISDEAQQDFLRSLAKTGIIIKEWD